MLVTRELSREGVLVGKKKIREEEEQERSFQSSSREHPGVGCWVAVPRLVPRSDSSESSTAAATRDDRDGRQQRRRPTLRPPHHTTNKAKEMGSLVD